MGFAPTMRFFSPYTALHTALKRIGYASELQTNKALVMAFIKEANDFISTIRTSVTDTECFTVCDNKIEIPKEWGQIDKACWRGLDMIWAPFAPCCPWRVTEGCLSRGCNNWQCVTVQLFTMDECYMHFRPMIPDGEIINVTGMRTPVDDEGFPLVSEYCLVSVSEYVAKEICLLHSDSRYAAYDARWLNHVRWSRSKLNALTNGQMKQLGWSLNRVSPSVQYPYASWIGTGAFAAGGGVGMAA